MPMAQLIMLKVGQDYVRGIETDGPDYAALEIIDEMTSEKSAFPPLATAQSLSPLTTDH